jgi:hypothetical protein
MTTYTSAELTSIIIELVIVLVIIRRSYAMTQGVPYSAIRLAVLPALIVLLWGGNAFESIYLTPWAVPYLIALDVAILIGVSYAFTPMAARMTHVERDSSGNGSFRIEFSLAALFVVAFVIRIGLAVVLFPSSLEYGAPPGGFPPVQQQLVIAVIDAIFSLSAGLVVARSVGIRAKWDSSGDGAPRPGV